MDNINNLSYMLIVYCAVFKYNKHRAVPDGTN